eukprot:Colp12_sorted_trinity150504_noHs@1053
MQVMVIEYAQNVLGIEDANSAEFDAECKNPIVVFMPEISTTHMGGTMRLGARQTNISTRLDRELVVPVVRALPTTSTTTTTTTSTTTTSIPAAPASPAPTKISTTTTSTSTKAYTVDHNRSLASEVYGFTDSVEESVGIMERHRHRYEVNPERVHELELAGLRFTGRDEYGERMEIAELSRDVHPHFLGVQYHPELKSRPNRPSPPLYSFASVVCAHLTAPGTPPSSVDVSKAGSMWREYDEGKKKEIAWIYSPKSGLKKRPAATVESPEASRGAKVCKVEV